MQKLRIILTLTDEQAVRLVMALQDGYHARECRAGRNNSRTLPQYVTRRVADAHNARLRVQLRQEEAEK